MIDLNKIEKIFSLSEIKSVNFSGTRELPSLLPFINLDVLILSSCGLRSMPQQIVNLKVLKTLKADHNDLYEICSLPKKIQTVDLSFNIISKLTPPKLNFIIELNISHNKLLNLDGLSHLTSLKYLYCSFNMISNLHCLNKLELLELDISENSIKNIDLLTPIIQSLQVLSIKNNPCINFSNFSGFFHSFLHQGNYVYYRKKIILAKSKLLKNFIPTTSINIIKNGIVDRTVRELEELRVKNIKLDQKVRKLEMILVNADNKDIKNRIWEIEKMSYEDWRSSLLRYELIKAIQGQKAKRVKVCKNKSKRREWELGFGLDKNRSFSAEHAKTSKMRIEF
ncbi:hypothetical protein SteCoe_23240 [Stentor coeruleus]|uniref:Uncharacterized protein n=1 Tax=Stentor coeruleus TaxID=5963 RepID=A0A1R2BKC1_9CILI|nr:hypothetical protein SteCoe_23240 [Stentor coeruleus]